MPMFTLDDLCVVLRKAGGEDELLEGDISVVPFEDLGCDSLALLEVGAILKEEYGVVSDGEVETMRTPREVLDFVNARLGPGHVERSVVIAAPFDLVWEMTNDVASWPELFSEYAAAEIIRRDGDTITFRLTMRPDENGQVWSWVSERTMDRARGVANAHRVETGPFAYMHIFWAYAEVEGGVEMRWVQDFQMKPGAPLDDAAMRDRIGAGMDVQMARIKGIVEQRASTA